MSGRPAPYIKTTQLRLRPQDVEDLGVSACQRRMWWAADEIERLHDIIHRGTVTLTEVNGDEP